MSYNFKKIMDLDLVTDVPEGANVLIETDGATKRLPSTAINNGYSKEEVYTKEESDAKYLAKSDFNIEPPDLAQNDQTQPDYVKNRTHWSETSIIIEEHNLTGFDVMEDPFYGVENPFTFSPVVGEHYIVHWDGTAYSVDAFDADGLVCLGNENYVDMTTGGNIPFAIVTLPSGTVIVVTESTVTSHTIAIESEVIHKLDKKYLPDNIGGGAEAIVYLVDKTGDSTVYSCSYDIVTLTTTDVMLTCPVCFKVIDQDGYLHEGYASRIYNDNNELYICFRYGYGDDSTLVDIVHNVDGISNNEPS